MLNIICIGERYRSLSTTGQTGSLLQWMSYASLAREAIMRPSAKRRVPSAAGYFFLRYLKSSMVYFCCALSTVRLFLSPVTPMVQNMSWHSIRTLMTPS